MHYSKGKTVLRLKLKNISVLIICLGSTLTVLLWISLESRDRPCQRVVISGNNESIQRNRSLPFLFLGGYERSGSRLAQTLLESYSTLRCNKETGVLSEALRLYRQWRGSEKETVRLKEAHVTNYVLKEAFLSFALEIILRQGPRNRDQGLFCAHEPQFYKDNRFLKELFPNSKFIFIVRDGRAVVHSLMTNKSKDKALQFKSYEGGLRSWSKEIQRLDEDCEMLGSRACLMVKYEDLVLYPRLAMEDLLAFIGLSLDDAMVYHSLAEEESSDQRSSLEDWVNKIPADAVARMEELAPSLLTLGYDPWRNPPEQYGATYTKEFESRIPRDA